MRVSRHCSVVAGLACIPPWSVNAGVVAGRDRTLVVDTGMTRQQGETIRGYASALGVGEILVVNTERHLDHIGGNSAFAGSVIHGHPEIRRTDEELAAMIDELNQPLTDPVRRELREAALMFKGTAVTNPSHPIASPATLDLGEVEALVFPTPGHTRTNLSVWVAADRVVFTGDCVVSGYVPNLEEGGPEDWTIWLRSLSAIEELQPLALVPGHGEVLFGRSIASELDRIRDVITRAIEKGEAPTLS